MKNTKYKLREAADIKAPSINIGIVSGECNQSLGEEQVVLQLPARKFTVFCSSTQNSLLKIEKDIIENVLANCDREIVMDMKEQIMKHSEVHSKLWEGLKSTNIPQIVKNLNIIIEDIH